MVTQITRLIPKNFVVAKSLKLQELLRCDHSPPLEIR